MPGEPSREGSQLAGALHSVHASADKADADVGVTSDLVRMRVMSSVLGRPPAETEPDQPVPEGETEESVRPPRLEDLAVPRVVAEEPELGRYRPQERREAEGSPGAPDDHETRPSASTGGEREHDLDGVVATAAIKEPLLLSPAL